MAAMDDELPFALPRKAPTAHEIGQPIDTLSVDELRARIQTLKDEIARLEAAISAREATRLAAAAFFKSAG